MIIYVIIAFVAILIGMAISVSAFGTGGKRKKIGSPEKVCGLSIQSC